VPWTRFQVEDENKSISGSVLIEDANRCTLTIDYDARFRIHCKHEVTRCMTPIRGRLRGGWGDTVGCPWLLGTPRIKEEGSITPTGSNTPWAKGAANFLVFPCDYLILLFDLILRYHEQRS